MYSTLRPCHYVTLPLLEANQEETLKGKTQLNRVIYTLNCSLEDTTVVCFSVISTCFDLLVHTQTKEVSYTDKWRGKNEIMIILV